MTPEGTVQQQLQVLNQHFRSDWVEEKVNTVSLPITFLRSTRQYTAGIQYHPELWVFDEQG